MAFKIKILLLVFLLTACKKMDWDGYLDLNNKGSATSSGTTTIVDTTPPVISSTSPAAGSSGVFISASSLSITFTEEVNSTTLSGKVSLIPAISVSYTGYDSTTKTATYSIAAILAENTTYTINIAADITDLSGNKSIANNSNTFTTAQKLNGQYTYNGSATISVAQMVKDTNGNIYMVGRKTPNPTIWIIKKIDSNGNEIWNKNPYTANNSGPGGIAIDATNNIYVGGGDYTNSIIKKYQPDGTEIVSGWPFVRNSTTNYWEGITSLVLSSTGTIYAARYFYQNTSGGCDFAATLYSIKNDGSENWNLVISTNSTFVDRLMMNPVSDELFTGETESTPLNTCSKTTEQLQISKYQSSGTEITTGGWPIVTSLTPGSNVRDWSFAFSQDGNYIYSLGQYKPGSYIRARIRKFDMSGNQIVAGWPKQFDYGTTASESIPSYGIFTTSNGDVYAVSFAGTPNYSIIHKIKADGTPYGGNWPVIISAIGGQNTNIGSIIPDGKGNILVAFNAGANWYLYRYSASGVRN